MDRPIRSTTPNTVMYDDEDTPKMKSNGRTANTGLAPPAPVYVAPLADASETMSPVGGKIWCRLYVSHVPAFKFSDNFYHLFLDDITP
jgi:hypothetical protein